MEHPKRVERIWSTLGHSDHSEGARQSECSKSRKRSCDRKSVDRVKHCPGFATAVPVLAVIFTWRIAVE